MEYRITHPIDLYDSSDCLRLATQLAVNRHLRVDTRASLSTTPAIAVCGCEDDYAAWISPSDLKWLELTMTPYSFQPMSPEQIKAALPLVIEFMQAAHAVPNVYLWGGTLGPNFDCSGLMQAAFSQFGIWLPRDAYQQEDFLEPISFSALEPGDLVFFGKPEKATHVGLFLGEGLYIHSSGQQGRNGIGIDSLIDLSHPVSQAYHAQLRGFGRVIASYQATGSPYPLQRDPVKSLS